MNLYEMGTYDVIVIGAGHAGCEAGLASARLGAKTLVLSIQLDAVALMACNPAIGGTGKGQLVREIDALGGEMGLAIDKSFIQSKMLNKAKGPAVHSLRAQADKIRYHQVMKRALEVQSNLDLKQGEAVDMIIEDGGVKGVVLKTGAVYRSRAVIIATGTFLGGKIFIGESVFEGGPSGLAAATLLSSALERNGIRLRRFKTGTPARVLGSSLNFSKMAEQPGDEKIKPFSFMTDYPGENLVSCWLTYTTARTHEIIMKNLQRSSLFSGLIEGVGPRYCPSIEDKVNRFADKERHQIFMEPEGLGTDEYYIQGMSSSMPEDVQAEFYRSVPGMEDAIFTRPAYSIEYDCINPLELYPTMEYKNISGLYCAGQFNGTSGYEEAAAQGLIAGINAALKIKGHKQFTLDRSEAYIGVLIDDLVTKGPTEPYRMMTSRVEYRLLLRQDNADLRLTEKGREIGLVSDERYDRYIRSKNELEKEVERLNRTTVEMDIASDFLVRRGTTPVTNRVTLAELLRRPEISYASLEEVDPSRPTISDINRERAEVHIKYEGYINKQQQLIDRFRRMEHRTLPTDIDYELLDGLRLEARQKLNQTKPLSLGQASRIAGVTPADVNVLMIHLAKLRL